MQEKTWFTAERALHLSMIAVALTALTAALGWAAINGDDPEPTRLILFGLFEGIVGWAFGPLMSHYSRSVGAVYTYTFGIMAPLGGFGFFSGGLFNLVSLGRTSYVGVWGISLVLFAGVCAASALVFGSLAEREHARQSLKPTVRGEQAVARSERLNSFWLRMAALCAPPGVVLLVAGFFL